MAPVLAWVPLPPGARCRPGGHAAALYKYRVLPQKGKDTRASGVGCPSSHCGGRGFLSATLQQSVVIDAVGHHVQCRPSPVARGQILPFAGGALCE
ncbi:hypothetical protein E2C01_061378 [Portunus trituberculatus]|uniref:Uncharacterized protein n=1 Tax=Portunus trituberculatus TaxID=210409 RepID=A0A5B7HBI0_PORTR|nr:hypothetical protein [Portunus trituberculatus]